MNGEFEKTAAELAIQRRITFALLILLIAGAAWFLALTIRHMRLKDKLKKEKLYLGIACGLLPVSILAAFAAGVQFAGDMHDFLILFVVAHLIISILALANSMLIFWWFYRTKMGKKYEDQETAFSNGGAMMDAFELVTKEGEPLEESEEIAEEEVEEETEEAVEEVAEETVEEETEETEETATEETEEVTEEVIEEETEEVTEEVATEDIPEEVSEETVVEEETVSEETVVEEPEVVHEPEPAPVPLDSANFVKFDLDSSYERMIRDIMGVHAPSETDKDMSSAIDNLKKTGLLK